MNKAKRIIILKRFRENNPHPKNELSFSSPFELLISVLLSSQTRDTRVNKVTSDLYLIANTPQKMLEIGIETIKYYIRSIGLFNIKAENIIKICHILLEEHNGEVPENRAALEAMPGIGRKTANVVLNVAFGWPVIAVDTHIFRLCNRTNFASGKNVKQVEKKLLKVVPKYFRYYCHHWLILHGRYTCLAHKPYCRSCIIQDLCEFKEKNFSNILKSK